MTRLTTADIRSIPEYMEPYDAELVRKTGLNLKGIACRTWGVSEADFEKKTATTTVAVIPVSWGQGVIQGFSEAVEAIVRHLGLDVFITREKNVNGLYEAAARKADIVMLSDDDQFAAIHLRTGKSVDNSKATGKIFAEGLGLMAGGLEKRTAVVVGCGPVGGSAALKMLTLGAKLVIVEIELEKAYRFVRDAGLESDDRVTIVDNIEGVMEKSGLILDASPAANIIARENLATGAMVAAPGVPMGLTKRAYLSMGDRVLHDPLQLGVAAMVAAVLIP